MRLFALFHGGAIVASTCFALLTAANVVLADEHGPHQQVEITVKPDENIVRSKVLGALRDDVSRVLRKARIGYLGLKIVGSSVEFRLHQPANMEKALSALKSLLLPLGDNFTTTGPLKFNLTTSPDALVRLTVTDADMEPHVRRAIDLSIQVFQRRMKNFGVTNASVRRRGPNQFSIAASGAQANAALHELVAKTGELEFRIVDTTIPRQNVRPGGVPPRDELLYGPGGVSYAVERRIVASGADIVDAQARLDPQTHQAVIVFRMNSLGAQRLAQATKQNIGTPLAVVLDDELISVPVIRTTFMGAGTISGHFTMQSANHLAALLRAGALPAPLIIVNESRS